MLTMITMFMFIMAISILVLLAIRETVRRALYYTLYGSFSNELIYAKESHRWKLGSVEVYRVTNKIMGVGENQYVSLFKYHANHVTQTAYVLDSLKIQLSQITPMHTMENAIYESINKMNKK